MASSRLTILAAGLLAAMLVAGCGENPEAARATGSTGTTGSANPYGSSPAAAYPPSPTANNPFGTPPATCTQNAKGASGALPATTTGTPVTAQAGCGQTGTGVAPAVPGKTGMEAAIKARESSGIFSKSLKGVTVEVTNFDNAARSRYLLVVFSKKGHEVEVQYKSVNLGPGGSVTLSFKATKDADDAKIELKDTLL